MDFSDYTSIVRFVNRIQPVNYLHSIYMYICFFFSGFLYTSSMIRMSKANAEPIAQIHNQHLHPYMDVSLVVVLVVGCRSLQNTYNKLMHTCVCYTHWRCVCHSWWNSISICSHLQPVNTLLAMFVFSTVQYYTKSRQQCDNLVVSALNI